MPSTRCALVAADWGPDIGLGHLPRSLALGAALRHRGAKALVIAPRHGPAREFADAAGVETVERRWPEWTGSADAVLADLAREHGSDTIVVDSYRVTGAELDRLRELRLTVVAIDDLARFPFPCQLVVNGGAAAHELSYRSAYGDTRFLLGTEYALLRPEFWSRPERMRRARVETVLLTGGGGAATAVMRAVLAGLDAVPGRFDVEVLVGPLADARPLEMIAAGCRRRVRLHRNLPRVTDLILSADLAVSAGGQTLYELACAGCPTIAFGLAANQEPNLRALDALGTLRWVGTAEDREFLPRLGSAFEVLLRDQSARAAMSEAGRRAVDGQGALRVARELVP